ncbi:MAG TPA: ABC transporter permease [Candidatus Nanopelagicaceae bacterium]|nr:ABC transporter permease [Candidatus Nanopelagicaceae bacterium]
MSRDLLRRLLFLVVSLFVAVIIIFLLLRLLPGDPANALLSINASPEQIAAARHQVGADKSVMAQFITWMSALLHLDFGKSYISGLSVLPSIGSALLITLPLTLISFVIAAVLSVVAGFLAAYYARRWFGIVLSGFSQLGIAVPVFWVGLILVWIFALRYNWFPSSGFPENGWGDPAGALWSLALPITTIVIVMSSSMTRYVKSVTTDVLGSDYIRTSRALGSSFREAFFRHGLRNASVPFISVLGIELASTLLGAVVVESVFSLPGLGSMLVKAIAQHDYPNIQGILLVTTFLVLVIGFIADTVQRIIDPRLRITSSSGIK